MDLRSAARYGFARQGRAALRIKKAVERFAGAGAGNIKRLHAIEPPEFRLRVGDYRVRFHLVGDTVVVLRVRNRREAYR